MVRECRALADDLHAFLGGGRSSAARRRTRPQPSLGSAPPRPIGPGRPGEPDGPRSPDRDLARGRLR